MPDDSAVEAPPRPLLPPIAEKPLLDLGDTTGPLLISKTTAYALAASGQFPVPIHKVGNQWRVRNRDLREYLGLDLND